jgi:hypothetical protein
MGEESLGLFVRGGARLDDDVHAPGLLRLVVGDLREHEVLLEAHGVNVA